MKKTPFPLLVCLLALGFACDIVISPGDGSDPVGSAVAATQTLQNLPSSPQPPGQTPEIPAPTTEGTLPADTPADTPAPACQPAHPGAQALPLPAGVAAGLNGTISFANVQAQTLSVRQVADLTFPDGDHVHMAGNLSLGNDGLPVVYHTLSGGERLRLNISNGLSDVAPAPNLVSLKGAEGDPFLAFVTVDMMNQSINRLYAGAYPSLSGAQPILTWTPPSGGNLGNAIHPLAVHRGPAADGIWFAYTMWGIGDLLYPPYKGLFLLDLATATPTEFLAPAHTLGGISPDQTLIAYGGGPPIQSAVTVRNLVTCQEIQIPFNPASNLGGGWMVFSPDNQLLAWTEAGGPDFMNVTYRMRVARTDGTSLFDAPTANMTSLLGGETPQWLRPVGWIANHLLVVEAYVEAIHRSVLVVWAPDPSQPLDPVLGANQSAPIADGAFLGFIYP